LVATANGLLKEAERAFHPENESADVSSFSRGLSSLGAELPKKEDEK